jgi:hypothetical protein
MSWRLVQARSGVGSSRRVGQDFKNPLLQVFGKRFKERVTGLGQSSGQRTRRGRKAEWVWEESDPRSQRPNLRPFW